LLIVALLAFSHYTYGAITISGNVTLSASTKSDWTYRKTSLFVIANVALARSVEVTKTGNNVEADVIVAAVTSGNGPFHFRFPGAFLGYWSANGSISGYNNNNQLLDIDYSGSDSLIAHSYIGVVEKNANGTVVDGFQFDKLLWVITDSSASGDLKYVTYTTLGPSGVKLAITFAISNHVGVLSLAGAIVTPKVIESIVEIKNYAYKDSKNTLTLVMVGATGSGSASNNVLITGSGSSKVYLRMNTTAIINNGNADVSIATSTAVVDDQGFNLLLKKKFSQSLTIQWYNVTFPAGASDITYDPSVGSGEPATPAGSTTNTNGVTSDTENTFAIAFVLISFMVALCFNY